MPDDDVNSSAPEILAPTAEANNGSTGDIPTNVLLAQVSNYTNRPDLFLEAIEKADPGFIKRMNQDAEKFGKKARGEMFTFGKIQAYVGLVISVIAALSILGILGFAIISKGMIGFWPILALGIVYAITQGGTAGFSKISSRISEIVAKKSDSENGGNSPLE